MRVTFDDLIDPGLRGHIPQEHTNNLGILLHSVNVLREASDLPFIIRNNADRRRAGYRTWHMHCELYDELKRKPPERSWHLFGGGCDILDARGELQDWINRNKAWVKENVRGSFEHFSATPRWVHYQIYYPKSLNMFFYP